MVADVLTTSKFDESEALEYLECVRSKERTMTENKYKIEYVCYRQPHHNFRSTQKKSYWL